MFLHQPGDLAEIPLAAVLIEALNHRATGVLTIDHGNGVSRLFVRDGVAVGAQSFTAFRPLGVAMLEAGLIAPDILERSAADMARTGKRQGDALVELGAVTPEQVEAALAEQQEAYLVEVAALSAGRFSFEHCSTVPEWTASVRLSPLKSIVQALEMPQAATLVWSALQPAASGPVSLAPGYARLAAAFGWSAAEAALVGRLSRSATLEQWFMDPGVAPERARAIVAALLLLGLAAPCSVEPDVADAVPALVVDLEEVGVAVGPEPSSTDARPRAPLPPGVDPGVAAARGDPEDARRRRQRLLQRAMQNIGVGPLARPQRATVSPPIAAKQTRAGAAPAAGVGAAGDAKQALREAFAAAAPSARSSDLFRRLGLTQGASRDQVRAAYFRLARQLHPDRFASPALADLAPQVKELFAAINEAYEVLSDERKRAAYLVSSGARGEVTAPDREAASIAFQKAEACARTRDHVHARMYYEAALRIEARPEYQAAYAAMLCSEPGAADRAKARALAEAALRDASCERAAVVCARFALDDGDVATAERLAKRALDANAASADAQRILRACSARSGREARPGSPAAPPAGRAKR